MNDVLFLVVGAALGAGLAALILRGRSAVLATRLAAAEQALATAQATQTEATAKADAILAAVRQAEDALEAELRAVTGRAAAAEALLAQHAALERQRQEQERERQEHLTATFKALSAESLHANNQAFLDLAKQSFLALHQGAAGDLDRRREAVESLIKPIHETLAKVGGSLTELEKSRAAGQATLNEQVQALVAAQRQLTTETATLARALRAPGVGGRWGEIQLKRVVELAGMLEYCDFQTQAHVAATSEEGRLRPDLVVRLPGGKAIAVDAKAPLQGYLDALDATDETVRRGHLIAHAKAIRGHLLALSAKSYWDRLEPSPEFVVLFLPGETFFSAALEQDPQLIEAGVESRVILATPTTLIALLRSVAYGWRQERLTQNAEKVALLGKELHERIRAFTSHLGKVGKGLDAAVQAYNQAVGSLETRVLPGARKFTELGAAGGDELPLLEPLEKSARALQGEA